MRVDEDHTQWRKIVRSVDRMTEGPENTVEIYLSLRQLELISRALILCTLVLH